MKYSILFVMLALISCRPTVSENSDSFRDDSVNTSRGKLATDSINLLMGALWEKYSSPVNSDTTILSTFNESDFALSELDTCEYTISIIDAILRVLRDDTAVVNSRVLIGALKANANNVESICYFPRNTNELNLLYKFTDKMMIASKDRTQPIAIVFSLYRYFRDVTEYAEHLHSVIPYIALNNTEGFLRELSHFDKDDRLNILANLEYLPDIRAIETLRKNLRNIRSKEEELRVTIGEAEEAINEIFEK